MLAESPPRHSPDFATILAGMSEHDHDHHHHDHDHSELSETELRVRALETILTEKGYVDPAALDAIIEAYETKIGPHNGARSSPRPGPIRRSSRRCSRTPRAAISTLGHVSRRRRPPRRGREHAAAPQHGRVHAVLLLSLGNARAAAGLVQVRALSLARGQGPARRARRFRRQRCRRTPRSASGIRPPRRASSCCRCGPKAPRAGARSSSPNWSRATA